VLLVKVYVSVDMEGTAGIVDWDQCVPGGRDYPLGQRLLLAELNAALDGALAAGATEIVVNDSHSTMRNLDPAALHGRASYLSGRHKPLYMMEGLDGSFDAVLMVSYHAAAATPGTLSHTYNPRAITEVRLNGRPAGESGINALVAQHHGVPVALVTGDQYVGPEAEPFCPGIEAVVVKRSLGLHTAHSLHPEEAVAAIRAGAERALSRVGELRPPALALPATLDVDFLSPDMAEQASWLRGVEQTGPRTASLSDDDPLRLYRTFITLVYLTRSLVETR
jgi:D-amino peptidase